MDLNAVYILWLRQLKRYSRSRARMLGSFGQPILFLVAFGFGFGPIYARAGGGNYIQFIAPGIISMTIMFTAVFSGIEVIWDKQFGFLKETLVAPVSRTSIVFGRILGGATVATIQGFIIFLITLLVGFQITHPAFLPFVPVFMFMTAMLFTACGTAIASVLEDMQAFPMIMNLVMMPLFFLSGSLFPLHGLPPAIELIARLDPLSYGVDGLRGAMLGEAHFGLGLDFTILGVSAALMVAFGSFLFSKIEI